MTFEQIRLDQAPAAVATITLARPERLDALSERTVDELGTAVEDAGSSGARFLLLTGEGAFSGKGVLAGHMPQAAELVEHPSGWRLEITDSDARRVTRLRLHAPEESALSE